jgi:hypothetical protein
MKSLLAFLSVLAVCSLAGCTSHINSPVVASERAARRAAFSDPLLARAYNAKPAIRFPATVAVATQQPDTREHLRALSAHGKLDTLDSLPRIASVVSLSPLLFNPETRADLAMREAAARVHADAVLIVAIQTHATDGRILAPLTELSLGLFPNKRYELIATALAALVDTRTGYLYGTLEKSRARGGLTMVWGSDDVIARARNAAERDALEKLVAEFPSFWRGVVQSHCK